MPEENLNRLAIHWYKGASIALHQIGNYILQEFGELARQDFMNEVEKTVLNLADFPAIGVIDPLFAHRKKTYRSIIVRKYNKIVYYVSDNTIFISGFWDTRREPKRQADLTK